jgi:hypothetical protein
MAPKETSVLKKLPIIGLLLGAIAAMFAMKKHKKADTAGDDTTSSP